MKDFITLCKKIFSPPFWITAVLTILSTAGLIVVFLYQMETHPSAYVVYVVAFYTLCALSLTMYKVVPNSLTNFKRKLYANDVGNRFLTDAAFRIKTSLTASVVLNFVYVLVNAVSGIAYNTRWFFILAGYYLILVVMRLILIRYIKKHPIGTNIYGEWQRARACACILTLINLSLSAAVLMMMYMDKGFRYDGILVYVMAMYTFYTTIIAIVNIVRYKKYNSPVMTMTKIISLAAALVSMLSLETAMLTAFGAETSIETKRILIAATGAGICAVVVGMSSYMIIRSTKKIDQLKELQGKDALSMSDKNDTSFEYSYSAKEQQEIKKIRERYSPSPASSEDDLTRLKRLDASVTQKATKASLIAGIIGTLVMGTGMSLVMTNLGAKLGMPDKLPILIGLVLGIVGLIGVATAFPIYNKTVKKEREKIAPEIIRLTDELMK